MEGGDGAEIFFASVAVMNTPKNAHVCKSAVEGRDGMEPLFLSVADLVAAPGRVGEEILLASVANMITL